MNKGGKNCIYGQFFKKKHTRDEDTVTDWKTNIFVFCAQWVKCFENFGIHMEFTLYIFH